jgi:hypothetical protein
MSTGVEANAWQGGSYRERDWRIWFGLSISLFWLLLGLGYIRSVIGWPSFASQPADVLGGFLEGAFAPLAFLWLVIGFFLQQKELRGNTKAIRLQYEEMKRSAEQAVIQARAISLSELHQRQDTFLKIHDVVRQQLGSSAGFLYISSQSEVGAGVEQLMELWDRAGAGDPEIFSRALIQLHYASREPSWPLFFGTEVRRRHAANFLETFERLVAASEDVDPQGLISDALRNSGHGVLYQVLVQQRDQGPPESGEGAA